MHHVGVKVILHLLACTTVSSACTGLHVTFLRQQQQRLHRYARPRTRFVVERTDVQRPWTHATKTLHVYRYKVYTTCAWVRAGRA